MLCSPSKTFLFTKPTSLVEHTWKVRSAVFQLTLQWKVRSRRRGTLFSKQRALIYRPIATKPTMFLVHAYKAGDMKFDENPSSRNRHTDEKAFCSSFVIDLSQQNLHR